MYQSVFIYFCLSFSYFLKRGKASIIYLFIYFIVVFSLNQVAPTNRYNRLSVLKSFDSIAFSVSVETTSTFLSLLPSENFLKAPSEIS